MERLIIADIRSNSIDGKPSGHYFSVASNYEEIFKGIYEVVVAGGPVYYSHFHKMIKLVHNNYCLSSPIINKFRTLKNCFDLFRQCKNDTIIFQCSAVVTIYLSIMLFRPKAKIFLIQYNTMSLDSKVKRFIFGKIKNRISGIICPSKEIGNDYKLPFCIVPDYVYTKDKFSKVNFTVNDFDYEFGIFGIIYPSKGVVEAAQFFVNTEYKVLIAGRPANDSIKKELVQICSNSKNITLILEYLNEDKYNLCIQKCRYCILNYSEEYSQHSSGVVYDLLFRNKPVLGKECRYLSFISEEQLGVVYKKLEDITFNKILNDQTYRFYLNNIDKFLADQFKYKEVLIKFIDDRK